MRYVKNRFEKWMKYDPESPSGLVWIKQKRNSNRKVGQCVGSLDKTTGYWCYNSKGKYKVHRIVWCLHHEVCPDDLNIDHIDGNRGNNKIENLRLVTDFGNAQNKGKSKNNTTEKTGVAYFEGFTRSGSFYSKYFTYVSWCNNSKRLKKSRSFSIQKYGEQEAFTLASEWRDKTIRELNEQGITSYSNRHGT